MDVLLPAEGLLPSPIFFKYSYDKYKTFRCDECGIGFKEANDLRKHNLITVEHQISCPICSFVFSTEKGMKQHFGKLHSKNRPSRCLTCKKRFRNKYALRFHVKQVHEQATRETCSNCNRTMYNQYSLNRHLKICKKNSV
jgi:rubredoxin